MKTSGFSLIELMVVVGIIAVLTSLTIPTYVTFKIRASIVERQQNARNMYNMAFAFRANNDRFPIFFVYGPRHECVDGTCQSTGCDPLVKNEMGFYIGTCDKLRYEYQYNSTDNTFDVLAISYHAKNDSGSEEEHLGSAAPTYMCNKPAGMEYFYNDMGSFNHNGVTTIHDATNALKNCFTLF